jgi:hypothetical protein
MQHSPYFDVLGHFTIKHEIGKAFERPCAQTRQVQFVGVAWGTRARMLANMPVGIFQCIDEAQRSIGCL